MFGWGWNGYAQLGLGHVDHVATPTVIDLPAAVVEVAAGLWHTLFLTGLHSPSTTYDLYSCRGRARVCVRLE